MMKARVNLNSAQVKNEIKAQRNSDIKRKSTASGAHFIYGGQQVFSHIVKQYNSAGYRAEETHGTWI